MRIRSATRKRITLLLILVLWTALFIGCKRETKPLPSGTCATCQGSGKVTTMVYAGETPPSPGQPGQPGQPGTPIYIPQTSTCTACGGSGKTK
jgi:hypothetical protein